MVDPATSATNTNTTGKLTAAAPTAYSPAIRPSQIVLMML